jgi:hypothetical protein
MIENRTLATLRIDHRDLILNDYRRRQIALWLIKLGCEYLNCEHDNDAVLVLELEAEHPDRQRTLPYTTE